MKLKIPRGTRPTITVDGVHAVNIHSGEAHVYLDPPLADDEVAAALTDEGFLLYASTDRGNEEMVIKPGLWTRVEVIK